MLSPLKIIFLVVDILLFILGIVVLVIGTWVLSDQKMAVSQLGSSSAYWLYRSGYLIIGFGLVVIFFSVIGIYAIIIRSAFLLIVFSICCFIPFIMVACSLGLTWYLLTTVTGTQLLEISLRNYSLSKDEFKHLEITLMCCGIRGPVDYNNSIPDSCIDVERSKLRKSMVTVTRVDSGPRKTYKNVTFSTHATNSVMMLTHDFQNVVLITAANVSNSSKDNDAKMSVDINSDLNRSSWLNRGSVYSPRRLWTVTTSNMAKLTNNTSTKKVYYQTGCLYRIRNMILTTTKMLSGLCTTMIILMIISFVIALILRKKLHLAT